MNTRIHGYSAGDRRPHSHSSRACIDTCELDLRTGQQVRTSKNVALRTAIRGFRFPALTLKNMGDRLTLISGARSRTLCV